MAHSVSARKRNRQNEKARARNRWRLRALRAAMKTFNDKVAHGTVDEASEALRVCCRALDRTAQRKIIHKNQAARRKSRLTARLKAKQAA
jgi:small subunit ribosomal protein S20